MKMEDMKCGECYYYIDVYKDKSGYCRRYPPMIKNVSTMNQTAVDYGLLTVDLHLHAVVKRSIPWSRGLGIEEKTRIYPWRGATGAGIG